jgi:acyl-CoA thioesterase I
MFVSFQNQFNQFFKSLESYFLNRVVKCIFLVSVVLSFFSCTSKENNKEQMKRETPTETSKPVKTILFFGNSITAGYGLDLSQAFPALIQKRLDSLKLDYKTINAGVSGETSAGGLNRIEWVLKQPVDIFVLELGANDGLRGIELSETKKNLKGIVDKVRTKYPDAKVVIAGMEIPPSMGKEYTLEFRKMYQDLAKEEQLFIIPFLLEGVAGETNLNQSDGIHPTAEGDKIVAENIWKVLKDLL